MESQKSKSTYYCENERVVVKPWEQICEENNIPITARSYLSFISGMKKYCGQSLVIKKNYGRGVIFKDIEPFMFDNKFIMPENAPLSEEETNTLKDLLY